MQSSSSHQSRSRQRLSVAPAEEKMNVPTINLDTGSVPGQLSFGVYASSGVLMTAARGCNPRYITVRARSFKTVFPVRCICWMSLPVSLLRLWPVRVIAKLRDAEFRSASTERRNCPRHPSDTCYPEQHMKNLSKTSSRHSSAAARLLSSRQRIVYAAPQGQVSGVKMRIIAVTGTDGKTTTVGNDRSYTRTPAPPMSALPPRFFCR